MRAGSRSAFPFNECRAPLGACADDDGCDDDGSDDDDDEASSGDEGADVPAEEAAAVSVGGGDAMEVATPRGAP